MRQVLARGRVLGKSNSDGDDNSRTFTLKSGSQARFVRTVVLSGDIEAKTYVDPSINGRDQAMLTPESVSDISRTIILQQFFPAIGREVNGRIEILDGTRRRAACIFNQTKFEILVTKDEINVSDARQLAVDIQTAREHSLRELGKRFEVMYDKGMTKEEIAIAENISPAKVTRAFQAAAVPDEMIAIFPAINDISLADYQFLLQVAEDAKAKGISVDELMDRVLEKVAKADHISGDKKKILAIFREESKSLKPAPVKQFETEKIREFTDRRQYARKKTDQKNRVVVYEFSRISPAVQAELDEAIRNIMSNISSAE
ncbi:ParB family protein [Enterobacter asburiae]|uniref:ParB family protein n=1 Tax=Enterobacter asburiae TaxID=61645 RepID=UPI0011D21126|nr:ParB family protein [Enterobacter asburiae]